MLLPVRRFVLSQFRHFHFSSLPDFQAFVQWWGDMANCLYPAFIGAGDACERLGLCKVEKDKIMMMIMMIIAVTSLAL